MQGTQVRQVLFKRPAPLSDRLCCEVPPEFSSCGGSNQTFMFYEVLTSLYHCNNHSIKVRQHTWGLLTWETETLHVLAVFTAKSGMEAPKVRVPTRDDGRNLIARARLDHMDRVQLERNGEQRVWAPRRTDLSHGTFKTSPVDQRLLRIRDSDQSIQIQSMDVHQHFTQRRYKGQGLSVALKLKLLCRHLRISAAWRRDKLIPVGVFVCPKTNKLKAFVKSRVPGFGSFYVCFGYCVTVFFSLPTHHIFWGAVLHHAGVGHLEQHAVRLPSHRGHRASSTESAQTPPALLKLPSQQGGGGRGGVAHWGNTHRTGVYKRQVKARSGDQGVQHVLVSSSVVQLQWTEAKLLPCWRSTLLSCNHGAG